MSQVNLVWITPDAEKTIAYCARVSSSNQDNPEYAKLIKYLIKHKHWSPMEMASMCVEIKTSKAIAAQILRHRSFSFQEFSARYSEVQEFEKYEARRQDLKNKQNSIDDMSKADKEWFEYAQEEVTKNAMWHYKEALSRNIAKEQARFLLPQSATSKLYMSGSIRSWVHYCDVRTDKSTQLEHREIAEQVKSLLIEHVPNVAKAMEWNL